MFKLGDSGSGPGNRDAGASPLALPPLLSYVHLILQLSLAPHLLSISYGQSHASSPSPVGKGKAQLLP